MRPLLGFLCGLLFGVGLVVGGMSDPAKVLNFLDLFGRWDPSLAVVMAGASVTAFIGYRLVRRRDRPLLLPDFQIPRRGPIDTQLLLGAAVFGIGWGIGGFCPGPAWTALPLAARGTLVFLPAMLVGMALAAMLKRRSAAKTPMTDGRT
ncbi:DUF6691 family protein [Mangrovibrevibacter kandeliae]|uniref:DUF6691 family protein n=1 Tax=Mangrovibrevibacter kandeliae TaxID=2968473 RepID=UPI002118F887|nr:DUF6691 family protein [Aurantimonas sp. CSK15Z-1]MCQ8781902.1 YeeE/YedE family protein [Aurantimonas sp. CSK15Z-1]